MRNSRGNVGQKKERKIEGGAGITEKDDFKLWKNDFKLSKNDFKL